MRRDKSELDSLVRALFVVAFGGWSAMLGYLGSKGLNKLDDIAARQYEDRQEIALIKQDIIALEHSLIVAEDTAKAAIDVRVDHGTELKHVRERILRLESKH